MSPLFGLLLLVVWIAFAALARWVTAPGLREGELVVNAALRLLQVYSRRFHHIRVEGAENIPTEPGALIVAPNHSAGVDPLLIQSAVPFEIRWMMAQDMRVGALEPLWEFAQIIFVDRAGRDASSARAALRHLRSGAALGVFPEGHIERPARHLHPFQAGIGFLARKSGAAVLPVVVDGAPQVEPAWASLWSKSQTTIRFLPPISYADDERSPQAIADDLRQRFVDATGWPTTERSPILTKTRRLIFDVEGRYIDEGGRVISDDQAYRVRDGLPEAPQS